METGLYYLQSRYYDPEIGRFINADGQWNGGTIGKNLFAYCENNPVNMVDPSGCAPVSIANQIANAAAELHYRQMSYFLNNRIVSGSVTVINPKDVTKEVNNALIPYILEAQKIRKLAYKLGYIGEANVLKIFYNWVNHRAVWDIKVEKIWESTIGTPFPGQDVPIYYNGMLMTPESLGNYTYGRIGAAFGISYKTLIYGSYYATGLSSRKSVLYNEFNDHKYISLGYMGY